MLPNEPEIVDARLPFDAAQVQLDGLTEQQLTERYILGWYGSAFHPDRGCYGIVNENGPLVDYIGDRVRITHGQRAVNAYLFGSGDIPYDFVITRRTFAGLELLAKDQIKVLIEVLRS